MNLIQSLSLGAVQGLTEFLPVSSSGHLALVNSLFKLPFDNLFFEVLLHLGTLFAVILYMHKKIWILLKGGIAELTEKKSGKKENLRYIGLVILGIVPAVIFAVLFDEAIEEAFSKLLYVGIFFLITSLMLYATKFFRGDSPLSFKSALAVGFAQVIALMPGISRSGTTISAGIFAGMKREDACDYSFFMAIPLIFGAFMKELINVKPVFEWVMAAGFLASLAFGYASVFFLYRILKSNRFYYFSYYLAAVGIFTVIRSIS
ncbi:MAG: undecaprenyl-diphosphate phosphatase [bacterium]|nr:undecaprenyl-diphosphate phosphatase [bacterium]